jgi:hypothetical protein
MDCRMTPPPQLPEPSWRKPVGMIVILALIAGWAGLIASASEPIGRLPWFAQAAFYTVAGIVWIWILPLRRLLRWMELGRWS